MTSATIQVQGLEEVVKRLEKLGQLNRLSPAIKAAAVHVKGKIAQYPPSSSANTPNQKRWYERGYGSKWMRRDGTIGGNKTSETLGRKWTIQMTDGGTGAVVGNNVSYGPFVQGSQQAAFHAARGWKTTSQVADEEADKVVKFIQAEIAKIILGGR